MPTAFSEPFIQSPTPVRGKDNNSANKYTYKKYTINFPACHLTGRNHSFAENFIQMRRIIFLIAIALIGYSIYWFKFRKTDETPQEPKQEAIKTNRHSDAFNNSFDTLMGRYFNIKAAFVDADTAKAKLAAKELLTAIEKLDTTELKKDSSAVFASILTQLNDVKLNAESLQKQTAITEMRQDFRMISESIYPLLKSVHYEGKTLYWQNCPMAFGEGKEANWISSTEEIINPYMGKNHPEFKGTMLHCGEVKDSIKAQ